MDEKKKNNTGRGTSNRGFASMNEEKQREIASKGGKAAHLSGHAHEFNSEEARIAGRKGGQASHNSRIAKAQGQLAKEAELEISQTSP